LTKLKVCQTKPHFHPLNSPLQETIKLKSKTLRTQLSQSTKWWQLNSTTKTSDRANTTSWAQQGRDH